MSPACTGRRMVRPVLAMPRVMAWRIHHVAYVENLKPLRQSNFSTACIRPRLPSWMRSSSGRPDAWYFLAIDTTRRRLDCTNARSASSPSRGGTAQFTLLGSGEVLADLVELVDRGLAGFDLLGESNFVILGEQHVLTDVGQIQADQVFFVALDAIFRHECSSNGEFVHLPVTRAAISSRYPRGQAPPTLSCQIIAASRILIQTYRVSFAGMARPPDVEPWRRDRAGDRDDALRRCRCRSA